MNHRFCGCGPHGAVISTGLNNETAETRRFAETRRVRFLTHRRNPSRGESREDVGSLGDALRILRVSAPPRFHCAFRQPRLLR